MTDEKIKTEDELQMELFCKDLKIFQSQYDNARIMKVRALQQITIYRGLIEKTLVAIKELERTGVKRVNVRLVSDPRNPAQQFAEVVPDVPVPPNTPIPDGVIP